MSYRCATCGNEHTGLPMAYGVDAPAAWLELPDGARDDTSELVSDQCVIEERRFFLRGRIPLPVPETNEMFYWGVWVEVSEDRFLRACELWTMDGRESEPAFECVLNTGIPTYPSTLGLRVSVQTQPVGDRPLGYVLDEHPLRNEQKAGISIHRIQEIFDHVTGTPA